MGSSSGEVISMTTAIRYAVSDISMKGIRRLPDRK